MVYPNLYTLLPSFQLEVTLEDMFIGKELSVSLQGGSVIKVKISQGMVAGHEIIIRGQAVDIRGMPRDLLFRLREKPHPLFNRKNADLLVSVKISLREAIMGFKR